ncbi:MAG: hypothetical protein E6G66_01780 [Actinobacteria bacterium]|nr:MAG: hypothetical protein E6G66_01780 [Actinomycetota bacterium]
MLSTVDATLPACTRASAWAMAWGFRSLTPTLPAAPATALCSELGRNPAAARPPVAAVAATTPMMAILAVIDPPKMLPNTSRFLHRGLRPRSSLWTPVRTPVGMLLGASDLPLAWAGLPAAAASISVGMRRLAVGLTFSDGCVRLALSWAAATICERWACRVAACGSVTYLDFTSWKNVTRPSASRASPGALPARSRSRSASLR